MSDRGGRERSGRRQRPAIPDAPGTLRPTFDLPLYRIASEEHITQVHDVSLRILEEAGIAFYDDESLSILAANGAEVGPDSVVRFDRNLIEAKLADAPSQWRHLGRDPDKSATIGGNHIVFAPVAGPPYVQDAGGGRRPGTYADLVNFIKMANATPYLHCQGTEIVVPNDVPFHERALDINYAHIRWGTKPMMGHYPIGLTAQDSVAMARIVFGEDVVASERVLLCVINVSSPRRLDDRMLGSLKTYARANQAIVVTPFILAGAMGPAAVLGTVAQANAEVLATLAFAQMVRPGTACVYGPFLASVDLQSGSPVMGSAESMLAQALCGQLAARYNLPFRAAGTYVSSKAVDMQAGFEGAMSMLSSMLLRPNFVLHAAGWMENGLTTDYEKFALDIELLGVFHRLAAGVSWDDDEWALESVLHEVPPGGHHLGTAHTLERFRTAFHRATLFDTSSYEQWKDAGSKDAAERGGAAWRALLDQYEDPGLDDAIDAELQEFMARRRPQIDPAAFQ